MALLGIGLLLYALTDRLAPASARGSVSAHVVQIAPRVSGEVIQVFVEDDAIVQAEDPLFALDRRPFELAVRQAEANLTTTVQNIDASSTSLLAAQAEVTQARSALDTVRAQAGRVFRLEERGFAAAAQGDAARNDVSAAEARLATAEATLDSARIQLGPQGADNPAIAAAQAQLEQAEYDLASATVEAPHYGAVTNVLLSEGEFVAAGSPALTFIDAEDIWVTVDLRENQLRGVEQGDAAGLMFDAVPGRIFQGRVQSIAWGIDAGRGNQGALVTNQPASRWFEPARSIPVRVEVVLREGEAFPSARVGGKVHAVIYAGGTTNPVAWLVGAAQRIRAVISYLH
jgi:multidrug resistance efflux pump